LVSRVQSVGSCCTLARIGPVAMVKLWNLTHLDDPWTDTQPPGTPRRAGPRRVGPDAMTDVDLAYLAGLFDGEGCVGKSMNACYLIAVSNSERSLCELFMVFGGSICETTHKRRHMRPQYQWRATGVAMARARIDLEPYLKVKRIPPQARDTQRLRAFASNGWR